MKDNWLWFTCVLLGNVWIWRIFFLSFPIFVLLLATTILLYLLIFLKKGKLSIFLLLFTLLLYAQLKTTHILSLTDLSDDEKRIQQQRLNEYQAVYFRIGQKTVWIPAAHWLEERKESVKLSRLQNNLSELLDLNLYFFANHPRERVGIPEFEKFPYIYLPFFLLGLFQFIESKKILLSLLSVPPLVVITIIGGSNPYGPLSLFPVLTITILGGLIFAYNKFPQQNRSLALKLFFLVVILITLQSIAYAKY